MGINPTNLVLANATLTNGARLVSAGSGFPQRIMPEEEYWFDVGARMISLLFGSDSASLVVSMSATLRKYNFAGVQQWSVAASVPWGLWRFGTDEIWAGRNTASSVYYQLIESTQALTLKNLPSSSTWTQVLHIPGGTADRLWITNRGTTLTEVVISTGLASGRTIAVSAHLNIWASNGDGVPGIYVQVSSTSIVKYKESDLTLEKTFSVGAGALGAPGTSFGTEMIVDSIGRPVVFNLNSTSLDLLDVAAGSQQAVALRAIWGAQEISGAGPPPTGGGNQGGAPWAFSADGRYFAYLTTDAGTTNARFAVRVKNLLQQRAEWSIAATSGTLKGIEFPGNLGNALGLTTGWRIGTTQDFKRAKLFYQRVGIDGARVYPQEWGIATAGLSLAGATELKLGVDFDCGLGKPGGVLPYLGGPNGEGPRVWIDDGIIGGGQSPGGRLRGSLADRGRFRGKLRS